MRSTEPARDGFADEDHHCECCEELRERMDELESRQDTTEGRVNHVLIPRLDDLEDISDDAREKLAELGAISQDQNQQIAQLNARVETLAGVDDPGQSNPEQRKLDLRDAMIKRADARGESGSYYRIKLWWEEAQDIFADRGHGEVSKPDCYKAMKQAANGAGFEMAEKVNENGNTVRAVAVDTEALREDIASSDPTTSEGVAPVQIGGETAVETTQD